MRSQSSSRAFSATNPYITSTLTPFLYQTKTLSTLQPFRNIASRSYQATPAQYRKSSLHTSALPFYKFSQTLNNDIPIRKIPFGNRTSGKGSRLPGQHPSDDVIYQTVAHRRT